MEARGGIPVKACNTCGVEKELIWDNFHINRSHSSGFLTNCKLCVTEKFKIRGKKKKKQDEGVIDYNWSGSGYGIYC